MFCAFLNRLLKTFTWLLEARTSINSIVLTQLLYFFLGTLGIDSKRTIFSNYNYCSNVIVKVLGFITMNLVKVLILV